MIKLFSLSLFIFCFCNSSYASTETSSVNVGTTDVCCSKAIHVDFASPFAVVPLVEGWVRSYPQYPDRFDVAITNILTTGFDAVVTRVDTQATWGYAPTMHWSAVEIPQEQKETVFQMTNTTSEVTIPLASPSWVAVPKITDVGASTIDILGREIHFSTVMQLLQEHTDFTADYETDRSILNTRLQIRGDTVYIDESDLDFIRGMKKISVFARELLVKDSTVNFQAPTACQNSDCKTGPQPGEDGQSGLYSPSVDVNVQKVLAQDLTFVGMGADGISGGIGTDGADGAAGADAADLTQSETCDRDCGGYWDSEKWHGRNGENGQPGQDGGEAGAAGAGGAASDIIFNTEQVFGSVTLQLKSGKGGDAQPHGHGGKGGDGGSGGCGYYCYQNGIWWCDEQKKCDDSYRGADGIDGTPGKDGFEGRVIPLPQGEQGSVGKAAINVLSSLKNKFIGQDDLMDVMMRYGETAFQRNDNDEALEVFSFIKSITDADSLLHQQVSLSIDMINQGYDYYGHSSDYATDLDWTYYQDRNDVLLETGKNVEDAFNAVQGHVDSITGVSSAIQDVATIAISAQDDVLDHNEQMLKDQKNLYVKAVRQLEATMEIEIIMANVLCRTGIKIDEIKDSISSLLGGIAGFVRGIVALTTGEAFTRSHTVLDMLRRDDCPIPKVEKSTKSLQENLDFGFFYERTNPADLDFSSMTVSAIPAIMLNDLAKNKEDLTKELKCLFVDPSNAASEQLEIVINNFFRDAALRVYLLNQILEIDVQLNEIGYSQQSLSEAQEAIDSLLDGHTVALTTQTSFSDFLLNLYQQEENTIMRSLYDLSKAYEFSSLWEFDALNRYTDVFSNDVTVDTFGSLQGVAELQRLRQKLDDERNVFLNMMSSLGGPTSHVYTKLWKLTETDSPELFESLHSTGSFMMKFEIDPNDIVSSGCAYCYNPRLDGLYIELYGDDQPENVPAKVYLKVAHMGDSSFLLPAADGGNKVKLLRQTPENLDGGHVMTFDYGDYVENIYDPKLILKFQKAEHSICEDTESFFGAEPCKSPYATYTITLPRNDNYACSLDPDQHVSGTNCQDFDFTKFNMVKVYAKINSWSDYPVQPDQETMTRHIRRMRMAKSMETTRLQDEE